MKFGTGALRLACLLIAISPGIGHAAAGDSPCSFPEFDDRVTDEYEPHSDLVAAVRYNYFDEAICEIRYRDRKLRPLVAEWGNLDPAIREAVVTRRWKSKDLYRRTTEAKAEWIHKRLADFYGQVPSDQASAAEAVQQRIAGITAKQQECLVFWETYGLPPGCCRENVKFLEDDLDNDGRTETILLYWVRPERGITASVTGPMGTLSVKAVRGSGDGRFTPLGAHAVSDTSYGGMSVHRTSGRGILAVNTATSMAGVLQGFSLRSDDFYQVDLVDGGNRREMEVTESGRAGVASSYRFLGDGNLLYVYVRTDDDIVHMLFRWNGEDYILEREAGDKGMEAEDVKRSVENFLAPFDPELPQRD